MKNALQGINSGEKKQRIKTDLQYKEVGNTQSKEQKRKKNPKLG